MAKEVQKEVKDAGNMPEKKFSAGGISASIWVNTAKKDGKDIEFRTVTLQRSYKDRNDEWQHTGTLRLNDMPKAIVALQKAYDYLVLKDE